MRQQKGRGSISQILMLPHALVDTQAMHELVGNVESVLHGVLQLALPLVSPKREVEQ